MPDMFRFKQFDVDQSGCAMKINTDGVLLGAMAEACNPAAILDIGTGTGVIALMLAQKFAIAKIDAVEIDAAAAKTADNNFKASRFANRLAVYHLDFERYFDERPGKKYDLVISNPPFYIDSLKSPGEKKTLAKHTDTDFFKTLIKSIALHLTPNGCCWLILPVHIIDVVTAIGAAFNIFLQKLIYVHSYEHSRAHRVVLCLGFNKVSPENSKFIIYEAVGVYSKEYKQLLQPYFIAF
ncbi:MAG TPA: methyltransferase [Mucilaginibacter sp.]|jgi:tRNA1Val (adenine37-N6)-methyltransferase|nr:methyltransferase [Mucilaginibacter sp.]